MTRLLLARLSTLGLLVSCAWSVTVCGCAESGNLGMAAQHSGDRGKGVTAGALASEGGVAAGATVDADATTVASSEPESTGEGDTNPQPAEPTDGDATPSKTAAADPAHKTVDPVPAHREFVVEGSDGALRVGFDDLDLLKILRMDPVTPDCVDKMPSWLRGLEGKTVRIRGFMKPGLLLEGIPQFMFVRDTGLCCFGPKGKIYDMIAVTLKEGTTTNYIELRPFDVVGKFRIELLQLEDDGTIFGLYYIDDARIIQK